MITHQELLDLLDYDPNTGIFVWKRNVGYSIKMGSIAGCKRESGYNYIGINKKQYQAHRLAWLYMTGTWPKEQVDHINGIRHDNRWTNLREANFIENGQNRSKSKNNKSGFTGVYWCNTKNTWNTVICINKKQRVVGRFDTKEKAHQAYLDAKQKYHTFNPIPR